MTTRLPVAGARPVGLASEVAEACVGARGATLVACSSAARSRREDAADRHVGKEAEHDEREQRAQIAAAGAGEIAAGAAAGEHHAEAEHQAAQDVARPVEAGAGEVHGLVEGDDAARLQQLGAHERGRRRQDPGAEAPPVAEVVDVG